MLGRKKKGEDKMKATKKIPISRKNTQYLADIVAKIAGQLLKIPMGQQHREKLAQTIQELNSCVSTVEHAAFVRGVKYAIDAHEEQRC